MAKAIGIGGAFMKAADPQKLASWYLEVFQLGDEFEPSNVGGFGVSFLKSQFPESAYVRFSIEGNESIHFPGQFMFNLIVDDIQGVLAQVEDRDGKVLRRNFQLEGVGEFAWIEDIEGNRVELWQPIDGDAT